MHYHGQALINTIMQLHLEWKKKNMYEIDTTQ